MLKSLLAAALDLFFPPLCHVCRSYISSPGTTHICPECRTSLVPLTAPLCPRCGIPFTGAGGNHLCGRCCTSSPSYDEARGAFAYEGPVSDLIHAFKYRNKTHLRRPLGQLTLEALPEFIVPSRHDLVLPVPLHRRKLALRGFNQAVLLGEIFACHAGLPFERHNLRRVRWTEPQINLSAEERRTNVKGAFAVAEPERLAGRRVLLVDDVFTTGSTVEECARVMKQAGAAAVSVITVARALK